MAKVSDQSNLSLERYFAQGLSGVTKRNTKESDDFKAFKQNAFLNNPNTERSAKKSKSVTALLQNNILDSYVLDNLQERLIHNDSMSPAEYGEIVRNLSSALKEEATRYASDSQEFKIFGAASKLAHQLEVARKQYKEGRDALLPV